MDSETLSFSYKYPFSNEAKEVVGSQSSGINVKYLDMAGKHIDNATANGLDYKEMSMSSVKLDYVMTYLYSRMLLSSVRRKDLIRLYAAAESWRSSQALLISDTKDMISVAAQLGIKITGTFDKRRDRDGMEDLSISFTDYINNAPKQQNFELVNQRLSGGIVLLNKNSMAKVIEQAIIKEITKGLPIRSADLPKEVAEYAKTLKFKTTPPEIKITASKKSEEWIEKLLNMPLADVRHRTVNLILAPYLVNVKGLEVEQACKIIENYIEKCREIDPTTRINSSYIRYQCTYAKKRGLKPLSLDRAKELLGSQVDLELQVNR